METPLSTRRVTRSQTAAASASASSINKKTLISKRSEESNSKSREGGNNGKVQQQETSCKYGLLDITNNSPIVGVAKGNLLQTPSSSSSCFGRSRRKISTTPGSGEALLRDQVKTLLQKVEEEGELSKVEFRPLFHHFHGSPMGLLLAPTPTNTPQVLTTLTYPQPNFTSQVVANEEEKEEGMNSQITRSLLLDFSDKSQVIGSCLSEEEDCSSKLNSEEEEEDSADDWSVQVNVSNTSHDDENGLSVVVDELCLGIENMDKRFVYNNDDDMVAEQVDEEDDDKLKKGGLLPQGKHIRFEEEDDDANTTN